MVFCRHASHARLRLIFMAPRAWHYAIFFRQLRRLRMFAAIIIAFAFFTAIVATARRVFI